MRLASGDASVDIRLEDGAAVIDGRRVEFRERRTAGQITALEIGGRVTPVRIARSGQAALVWASGRVFRMTPAGGRAARSGEHAGDIISPMPGRVLRVLASNGQTVQRGQPILVLEAMKMEHVMRAGRAGTIAGIACEEGQQVEAGAVLAEIGDEAR
jgi:biotin carboxyl carrier protein